MRRSLRQVADRAGQGFAFVLVAIPIASLITTVFHDDAGTGGSSPTTAFHLAIGLADPYLIESVRTSAVAASIVAGLSILLGGALAALLVHQPIRGRDQLLAFAFAPAAVPPLFLAWGYRAFAGANATNHSDPDWAYFGWILVGLIAGVPGVMNALLASLEAIPRSGLDAARAAGAGLIARSRRLLAPFVLPPLFLAVGRAFLVQFVDPGAPLALGIRQSFGSQFVEAFLATRPYPHRAALLAITAVAIALPIGFWTRPRSDFGATHQDSPSPARGRSWVRSVVALLAAGAWSFLGFGLVYGLVRLAFSQSPVDPSLPPVGAGGLELEWVAAGVRTLAVGLAAGALAWWFALALAASATAVRATPFQTFTLALARLLPPILLAAGWLCLAEGLESWLAPVESSNPVARSLLGVARALDPRLGMPWALIAVLSLMILPRAQAHVSRTRAERGLWRSWIETATVLGATPREARRRLIAWRAIAGDFGFLLLAAAAGCEASAALLLARAPGAQTLSTLSWSQWLEAGATAAAAPALLATLITIAAALVASFGSEFEATRPSQSATRTS